MSKDILDKKDFIRRYHNGEFGNRFRSWDNILDIIKESNDLPEYFSMRSKTVGGTKKYNIKSQDIMQESYGDLYYYNESAPDHLLIFQGEIYRNTEHLHMHWSKSKKKMSHALKESPEKPLFGVALLVHLKYYMNNQDYEWLMYLLDTYEDHTIEFGVYSKNVGILGERTIIWEVRKY